MRSPILTLILILLINNLYSQKLPLGYTTYFQTSFTDPKPDTTLLFSHDAHARINKGLLSLTEKPDSIRLFFPPATVMINYNIFGDFIAELKINQTGASVDSSDGFYLITGLRDSLNYYFVRIGEYGSSFNRIYKGKLSTVTIDSSFALPANTWTTIRIERDILSRTFTIKSGTKKMVCTDVNLVMGYFGFGVKNKKLIVDSIIIWAPTSMAVPAPLFK
jgi:hypothetical protein